MSHHVHLHVELGVGASFMDRLLDDVSDLEQARVLHTEVLGHVVSIVFLLLLIFLYRTFSTLCLLSCLILLSKTDYEFSVGF